MNLSFSMILFLYFARHIHTPDTKAQIILLELLRLIRMIFKLKSLDNNKKKKLQRAWGVTCVGRKQMGQVTMSVRRLSLST